MNRLHNTTYLIIGSDLAMSYNKKRIYGICCTYRYPSGLVNHCLRRAYTTEQGRIDAMRDMANWYKTDETEISFADVLYIEKRDWPNHPLYKEVTEAMEEEQKRIKSEHDSKLKEMIKTNPCKALLYYKYKLTFWQKIYCKIQCYAKKL